MYKKILIAVDGSQGSRKAVQSAARLVEGFPDTEVILVTVMDPVPADVHAELTSLHLDPVMLAERNAQEMIEEVAAPLREVNIPYGILIEVGDPGSEICLAAREGNVDLVVVGTRGRNPFSEIVLGSVSHRVLHHAPCPVLIVR